MKLEPIAKPIRIRIKLGKSEFSSLDDVKRNFSIEELYPLFKDGRLERWLVQIGEYSLANKVKEFSPKCGNGDIRDHILFLSLFFDKVSKSFDETEISKESWFMTVETLSIYAATKGYNQNGLKSCIKRIIDKYNITTIFEDPNLHKVFSDSGEWGFIFADLADSVTDCKVFLTYLEHYSGQYNTVRILKDFYFRLKENRIKLLNKDNVITFFEDPDLHKILSDSGEWGSVFASYIENNNDYRNFFSYLVNYSGNTYIIPQVLKDFYKEANKLGYEWRNVYHDDLNIDFAVSYYKNPVYQSIGLDWGFLFADLLQDWNHDGQKIINILKDNKTYLSSFYNHCLELGKRTADPWYQIANSQDCSDVLKVLERFRFSDIIKNTLEQTKNKVNTFSAQEVITFLEDLLLYHEDPLRGKEKIERASYQSFLSSDWLILKSIRTNYNYLSNEKNLISSLNDIQDQNDFAKKLIDEDTLTVDKSIRFFRAVFALVGDVFKERIYNSKIK